MSSKKTRKCIELSFNSYFPIFPYKPTIVKNTYVIMENIFLHGKRAVKVNAKSVMWGVTDKARLYDIDGDEKWIPNSLCEYNEKEGTLIIEEWFYNKLFPNENTV